MLHFNSTRIHDWLEMYWLETHSGNSISQLNKQVSSILCHWSHRHLRGVGILPLCISRKTFEKTTPNTNAPKVIIALATIYFTILKKLLKLASSFLAKAIKQIPERKKKYIYILWKRLKSKNLAAFGYICLPFWYLCIIQARSYSLCLQWHQKY